MRQVKLKLEIGERRIFSEELKKKVVKELVSKRTTIRSLMAEHQVSANTVYRWLYKYSPHHEQKCTLVVQMKVKKQKTKNCNSVLQNWNALWGESNWKLTF